MVALSFKPDFAFAIGAGRKTRTIRRVRKSGNPQRGDVLQLYTGMRTSKCEKIRDATCTRGRPVTIDHTGVTLDGRRLYGGDAPAYRGGPQPESYDGDFARADGFDSFSGMLDFFEKHYKRVPLVLTHYRPFMTLRRPRPRPSHHRGLGRQLRQPYSSSRNFAAHEWVLLALDAT
jgi:hypothetical protein